ncbi:terminase large subunit domain-containing protein [Nocardiopsis dassonvillei]|uniref:terminase large subunit domain-containing protein n=1 Tax=Nocardiopsis dassonvillei TaxID=2014 RepID=UPI0036355429
MAAVARLLGKELMPWQKDVLDVALEIDPRTGRLAYREVVLTVPRQSGKTLLMLALMVQRALGHEDRQTILYAAQTRNAARKKWEEDHVFQLKRSPLRSKFTVRLANGAEAIRWKNGSLHGITSNTESAGHGDTLDLAVIDEAFAQRDSRLEQAMKPTMITRPQPQLWIVSTAGKTDSVYLRGKVDNGRQRVGLGLNVGMAYFEWSAPDDADPADEDTWWACMPALGHTVSIEAIRADFVSMELPEFRRAYLNQWPDASPEEWLVIPREWWDSCHDPASTIAGDLAICADVTPERTMTSIAVAGRRDDGFMHVEILEHASGTTWAVKRIKELVAKHQPVHVVIDGAGPAGSLITGVENAGIEVTKPTARDVVQACGAIYDAAKEGEVRHIGSPPLNTALASAQKRPLGDAWAWARKSPSGDISPLVAATLAMWGAAKGPDDEPAEELDGPLAY